MPPMKTRRNLPRSRSMPIWTLAAALLLLLPLVACAPDADEGEDLSTEEARVGEQEIGEEAAGEEEPLEAPGEGFADESAIDPEAEEDGLGAGAAEEEPELEPTPTEVPEEAVPAATSEEGRHVFVAQGCGTCHSVSTAGIEARVSSDSRTFGGDLAGVDRSPEEIRGIVSQEIEAGDRRHPKRFGGSDEELALLIDWLLAQG